jgi:hypothetical protein
MALSRHDDDVLIQDVVSVSLASRSMDSVFVAYVGKSCVYVSIPSCWRFDKRHALGYSFIYCLVKKYIFRSHSWCYAVCVLYTNCWLGLARQPGV